MPYFANGKFAETGSVTPTVTVSAYAAGSVLGGVLTFPNFFSTQYPILDYRGCQAWLADAANLNLSVYLFGDALTGSYADQAAFVRNAADLPLGRITATTDYVPVGSGQHLQPDDKTISLFSRTGATSLLAVCVLGAAYTPSSTAAFQQLLIQAVTRA